MRKAVGLALLGALALGCGSAGSATTASGLKGRVMRGPIQPVCRVNEPCDEPARNTKLHFYRSGKLLKSATTNQQGWYRILLRPGQYTVRTNRPSRLEKVPDPARVRVPTGRVKRVDFQIDTGIR